MTKGSSIIFSFCLLAFLSSCGGSREAKELETTTVEEVKKSTFTFNPSNTSINWTAYKTTELVGVSGKFNDFTVEGATPAETPIKALENITINIPIAGVFSENPERDERIRQFFFGEMSETDALVGGVKSLSDESAILALTMNGVTNEVTGDLAVEGKKITFNATISLVDYQAKSAVDALNEECGALHAGSDGVSFLSPDVKIEISTTLDETTM